MPQTAAQIIIPDDFPPVISGTPALQTMQAHGAVTVYTSRPETQDENVVLSPHTAGTTPEALMHGLNLCAANVVAFLQGQVQNRVV